MPYYSIENFAAGMDVRKSALTAPAGTLRTLKNAHVTPGAEIEKRQAFIYVADLPANSVGLATIDAYLYTFVANGTSVTATATTPGVQSLPLPVGVTIASVLDWDTYAGKLFVIVKGSDDQVYRFYDGVLVASAKGTACRTYKSKIYSVEGSKLYFSAVGNPADWTTSASGAGFIDLSTEDSEMSTLVGLEVYYDKLAVFSQRACQIWTVDPDPNKNTHVQTLRQAGSYAPKSIRQYGSGDVLYLAPDGIRSLKARLQSITASVSDIGSPIDPAIRDLVISGVNLTNAISLLEPLSGRYWVVLERDILVLSNYPSPQISAWGVYDAGFAISDAVAGGSFIYLRASDSKLYKYGGGTGAPVYDACAVEVVLPYLSFGKPATFKQFNALDFAASGTWQVYAGINPHNEIAEDNLGAISGPTFLTGQFPMMGHSTHVSLRLRSSVAGACTMSNIMVHYQETGTS